MVATDRLSAFDVVLPDPIPEKGRCSPRSRAGGSRGPRHIVPNHLLAGPRRTPCRRAICADWRERSMRCARAERIDVECVVRGSPLRLRLEGVPRPGHAGRRAAAARAARVLAAARAALHPGHQERQRARREHQPRRAGRGSSVRPRRAARGDLARALPLRRGALRRPGHHPRRHQVRVRDDRRHAPLIDEIFTPDSSRFWEASEWREGEPAVSFDKQPVRDYLETLDWDKRPPGPELPPRWSPRTTARYLEAARRICGLEL